jgi:hypothetical protein
MRRVVQLALLVLLGCSVALAQNEEVLDRIIAVVNNSPIFQSDWELALRCEALMDDRAPDSFSEAEKQQVFSRLVDQQLIQQQMKEYPAVPVTDAELQTRLSEIRKQVPQAQTDAGWQQLLDGDGLTQADVLDRVRRQIEILRFLDLRLRPLVRVDFRSVTQYYRDQYLPELRRRGAKDVPIAEVSDKIREILTQQRLDEQIQAWMQSLREGSEIRLIDNVPATTSKAEQK